jgi:hypothetical protein
MVCIVCTLEQAIKALGRSRGIALPILNFIVRRRWTFSFTPRPLYPREKSRWYPVTIGTNTQSITSSLWASSIRSATGNRKGLICIQFGRKNEPSWMLRNIHTQRRLAKTHRDDKICVTQVLCSPLHVAWQTCADTIIGIFKPNCLKKVQVYLHKRHHVDRWKYGKFLLKTSGILVETFKRRI